MKPALKQALAECLARLEGGAGVDECLRGREALAAELRPLLEAAQALRQRGADEPSAAAFQRGKTRMHSARVAAAERGGGLREMGLFWRPAGLLAVAAVIAILAALGLTTDIFRFGAEPTSAQVDGVVSRADPNAILLITADGNLTIRIGDNTIVLDANGKPIKWGDITPGRSARIEVEEENGEYSAQRIEVDSDDDEGHGKEVEFEGVVTAVNGNTVTVQASFGEATVVIGPQTDVKGQVTPGATVEVDAVVQDDDTYLAEKIEAKGDDSGEDGGDGDDDGVEVTPDSSGSGSGDDSSGPGSGSGGGETPDSGSDGEPDHSDD